MKSTIERAIKEGLDFAYLRASGNLDRVRLHQSGLRDTLVLVEPMDRKGSLPPTILRVRKTNDKLVGLWNTNVASKEERELREREAALLEWEIKLTAWEAQLNRREDQRHAQTTFIDNTDFSLSDD